MKEIAHIVSLDAFHVFADYGENFLFGYWWTINSWDEFLLMILKTAIVGGNNDHSASFRKEWDKLLDKVDGWKNVGL